MLKNDLCRDVRTAIGIANGFGCVWSKRILMERFYIAFILITTQRVLEIETFTLLYQIALRSV